MKIFIMRHGEAANISGEDSRRPLTAKGILETEKAGHWLAGCKSLLMNVFVSPYLRTQQTCSNVTAVLAKTELLDDITPQTLDFITPAGDARHLHNFIDGLLQSDNESSTAHNINDNQSLLFISHMPLVSYLVSELTGSLSMPIFSTGEIAVIDYDIKRMQGRLVEMVIP